MGTSVQELHKSQINNDEPQLYTCAIKDGKKEVKYILVANKVKQNAHIVPSSMQKARTTLVQPLVMADRPSFTVFMKTSR